MKLLYFLFLTSLLSCTKQTKETSLNPFIHKSYFSVLEYNRKLDSTLTVGKKSGTELLIKTDKRYNQEYHLGGIHFMILDSLKSFYIINYLEKPILLCGNVSEMSKKDSLRIVNENISKIQQAQFIRTPDIKKILTKYRRNILSNNDSQPIQITFALKNDTLFGDSMFNILNFMEKNKMSYYIIRRMNDQELKKVTKEEN